MNWWKNKRLRPALFILGTLFFLALARDFLANGRPLVCKIQGAYFFPGLRTLWKDPALPYRHPVLDSIQQHFLWRRFDYETAVFAPIPFSPGELPGSPDTTVRQARPGALHPGPKQKFRHWLGTDPDGYDIAAGVVSGARVAILSGAIAMSIAFGIGITFGAIAGYWGDERLRIRRGQLWAVLASLPLAWFYTTVSQQQLSNATPVTWRFIAGLGTFTIVVLLFNWLGRLLSRLPWWAKKVAFPVDLVIMRLAEIFTAVPVLLVIIAFASMLQEQTQSIWAMIFLIGAFIWPAVSGYVRAELLRIRELDYVTAAKGIGLSEWRILLVHALPNALRPAYTTCALGVAVAILLEASLSFLGYGDVSMHGATWGSLLRSARSAPQLWWISLPPGLAIGLTIMALNAVGEALSERR